jgi:hypothetical protein
VKAVFSNMSSPSAAAALANADGAVELVLQSEIALGVGG